ncbi:unnamed protein product [Rhizophagus irregularis]|nr:unnamed protein product [Rhizophagus irregularis]CAB4419383.1 unnamed protein product [Rhizophagus irregularis]
MNENRDKSRAQGDTEDEITEIVAQKNDAPSLLTTNTLISVINVEEEIAGPKADLKLSLGKGGRKEERKIGRFYVNLVIGLEGGYTTILMKNINHNCCCTDQCA